ncbi:hypothetical protein GCM10023088_67800 [Actinomadura verrucosospora]
MVGAFGAFPGGPQCYSGGRPPDPRVGLPWSALCAFPVARNAFLGGDPQTPDVGDSVPHAPCVRAELSGASSGVTQLGFLIFPSPPLAVERWDHLADLVASAMLARPESL